MFTKAEIKYYSSLLHKKYRNEEQKFIVEGKKLVEEALNYSFICEVIVATPRFEEENPALCQTLLGVAARYEVLSGKDFLKLTDTESPQGIVAVVCQKEKNKMGQPCQNFIVALENISDPGNLGAILRNCDWFGVKTLILSKECAEVYNPKVLRASMGSAFHLDIYEADDFPSTLSELKEAGYTMLCADLEGENVLNYRFPDKSVIIFGNEAHGPTQEISSISKPVTIPKFGNAESLNVASASAVILSRLKE